MSRVIAVIAAILVSGCGSEMATESPSPTGPDAPLGPTVGSVRAQLLADTTTVKLVLRNVVEDAQGIETGRPIVSLKNELVDDTFQGVLNVPCDGRKYVAEVYGTNTNSPPFRLHELHVSAPFTMPVGCSASPDITWNTPVAPTLVFPAAIYVGLGAPNDKYTVNVQGLAYPWSQQTWSLVQGTTSPLTKTAASAVFAAPVANGSIDFTARFHLDRQLLVKGESVTSWVHEVASTQTAVTSYGIPVP